MQILKNIFLQINQLLPFHNSYTWRILKYIDNYVNISGLQSFIPPKCLIISGGRSFDVFYVIAEILYSTSGTNCYQKL